VDQRLSGELQTLAAKFTTEHAALAHTTTRALDASTTQWQQWSEEATVSRDELLAMEGRLREEAEAAREEWQGECRWLRTALATAKAEVAEVRRGRFPQQGGAAAERRHRTGRERIGSQVASLHTLQDPTLLLRWALLEDFQRARLRPTLP
jgi:hypothetical protein